MGQYIEPGAVRVTEDRGDVISAKLAGRVKRPPSSGERSRWRILMGLHLLLSRASLVVSGIASSDSAPPPRSRVPRGPTHSAIAASYGEGRNPV